MKRLLSITIIAAAGLVPGILQSQMRGGMGGGGARGSAPARGGVAVRSGPVAAPHFASSGGVRVVSPGVRVVSPGVRVVSPGVRVVSPSGVVVARGSFVRFHNRFHNRFFFNNGCFNGFNCGFFPGIGFGFGFGTGFGFGGGYPYYGAPYYPYDYSAPPPQYYPPDYYGMAAPQTSTQENANDVYLAQMLQKLSDEVEDLKKSDQKSHTGSAVALGPKADNAGPAAVFIFHDGTRISTHNYAIAGQTIWVFSETQARKFRLSDLDRAATEQANAVNGIELRLPEPAPER
jgi:hypothetical protein